MPLNIKNPEADRLARELAEKTGESIAEVVTNALRERLAREERRLTAPNLAEESTVTEESHISFPIFFPEKPKPPRKRPERLLLIVAVIIGAWLILAYVVMPLISAVHRIATSAPTPLPASPTLAPTPRSASPTVAATPLPASPTLAPTPQSALPTAPSAPLPESSTGALVPQPSHINPVAKPQSAVVGHGPYYFFLPPSLHGTPDTSAPLNRWQRNGEFRSAAGCERFRRRTIADTADDRDQDTAEFASLYEGRIKLFEAASCVSADDPRMKDLSPE